MVMACVYVAGAYSADNVIDIQANMRHGLNVAHNLLLEGYAPFAPWLDFTLGLIGPVTLEQYYAYSIAWLLKADAVFVVRRGVETSRGTQAEIRLALESGIPAFSTLRELDAWSKKWEAKDNGK